MNNLPIHYNYQALDKHLTEDSDPVELGDQLDEIMQALASHAASDESYHIKLEDHYHVLRTMRNIFWKLERS
jgi:hypothetical protein